jgi:hypothetical protein
VAAAVLLASSGCGRPSERTLAAPEPLESPAGPGSGEPHLAVTPEGTVYLSWFERFGAGHALRIARLEGDAWTEPMTVAEGDSFFVNWADFPTVVGLGGGRLAAHYAWMNGEGTYAYDVVMRFSEDGGFSWGPAIRPHTDGTATEHGFVSLLPAEGGARAVWLDGRNAAGAGAGHGDDAHGHGGGPDMTLRSAVVHPDGRLSDESLVDPRVCDCCATDAVATPSGVLVAYRDRSDDELRDVSLARLASDGTWGEPMPLHLDGWRIAGCPVNGPALDARDGRLLAAWYTAPDDSAVVRAAFASDTDPGFGAPVRVDDGNPIGRVDAVLIGDGAAAISWLEQVGDSAEVRIRRVAPAGSGPAITVDVVSASRASGVPRMVRSGDRLILAWTASVAAGDPPAPTTGIRLARIDLR